MEQVLITSIPELLITQPIKGSRTKLAKVLKISRNTLRNYLDDRECCKHVVLFRQGFYVFMNKPQEKKK